MPIDLAYDVYVSPSAPSILPTHDLCDHSSLHFSSYFLSLRCYRVHLVDEDDARGSLLGFLEDLAESSLRLAVELRHYLWTGDYVEVCVGLVGNRLRQQGLSASRRTIQKDSLGRLDA